MKAWLSSRFSCTRHSWQILNYLNYANIRSYYYWCKTFVPVCLLRCFYENYFFINHHMAYLGRNIPWSAILRCYNCILSYYFLVIILTLIFPKYVNYDQKLTEKWPFYGDEQRDYERNVNEFATPDYLIKRRLMAPYITSRDKFPSAAFETLLENSHAPAGLTILQMNCSSAWPSWQALCATCTNSQLLNSFATRRPCRLRPG